MELEKFVNKRVRIIDVKGKQYEGLVIAFSYAKDEEANEDAIDLSCGSEIYESEITSIEVIGS